jgi:hypothetical protein
MSGVSFNLHFAFALEGGDFISSLSDSIDSIRRSEEVDGVRLSYMVPLMLPIKRFLKTMG